MYDTIKLIVYKVLILLLVQKFRILACESQGSD